MRLIGGTMRLIAEMILRTLAWLFTGWPNRTGGKDAGTS
jgi:hypothetical protein